MYNYNNKFNMIGKSKLVVLSFVILGIALTKRAIVDEDIDFEDSYLPQTNNKVGGY